MNILRRFSLRVSTEDRGQGPQVAVAGDLAELFFGKQPGRSNPALDHLLIPPSRHVAGAAGNATLGTFDHISGGKAIYRATAGA